MTPSAETVQWDALEHAYGAASDVPALLETFSTARGRKLREATGELYSRVLHQGTIYSSSPPVARVAIEMSRGSTGEKKVILYDLLSGFAEAARTALADGVAIPCCAGGDPADGAAIRDEILAAHQQFAADLAHKDPQIRGYAADLLTAFPEAGAMGSALVRDRYFAEQDPQARRTLFDGLLRVRASLDDWQGFLNAALERESVPVNRFSLLSCQVQEMKTAADDSMVDDLVSAFAQASEQVDSERFFESLRLLGAERERAALVKAVKLINDECTASEIAERLLRAAFEDQRSGWGQHTLSLLNEDGSEPPQMDMMKMALYSIGRLILWKMFPFLLRRKLRRKDPVKGIRKIEYRGLKGQAPVMPEKLSQPQRDVLMALADQPAMWKFRTNLWQLFGLPTSADGLRGFIQDRG